MNFDEVIETLYDDFRPTLHRVVPVRLHLIHHCDKIESDEDDDFHEVRKLTDTHRPQLCYY